MSKEIAFTQSDGSKRTIVGGAFIATDSNKKSAKLASWREVGDASARTKAIKLVGNNKDNKLIGGSGKDSLTGGKGNDSLWGGDGADTFIYNNGDGKDVICGFEDSDMLKINGTFGGTYNKSKKEVYFKVDSTASAITLKNFTASTFNVNGTDYKISGKKLVEK